jgi:lysozyme
MTVESLLRALVSFLVRLLKNTGEASAGLSKPLRGISGVGLDLIKQFEGLRLEAYQDSVGVWTIGYGHTKTAKQGMRITERGAEDLLRHDLEWVEQVIKSKVTVSLEQHQYDALCSFIYNLGGTNFGKSTLLKRINAGDFEGAANEFPKWNKAGGKVLNGLTRRRKQEQKLFRGP